MKILVLNCGSSSIKYKLFDMTTKEVIAQGGIEKIGLKGSFLKLTLPNGEKKILEKDIPEHTVGVEFILNTLISPEYGAIKSLDEINAVGHRMVHGGERFSESVLLNKEVLEAFTACNDLAPLHNPANLKGVNAVSAILPNIPQVGVFDTAFHQTMPDYAYMYAIPYELYEKYGVRRYGFHGTSHRYVSKRVCEFLGVNPEGKKIITCHIGNGGSIAAIKDGKCIDTTMGLTPLEGLMMGTRSGDIDAGAVTFIMEKEGLNTTGVSNLLNKKSGVLGISGVSSDMRELLAACAAGNEKAILAEKMYYYRIKKYIGAYAAALGGVDSMTVTPFDKIYETPDEFSERLARNQQLLLKEESHFDKVIDPAAGSYYVETLTVSIAEQAWKLFLEVEEKGGFYKAVKEGFVQNQVNASAETRHMNVARRKEILLGTNQYPNFNEVASDKIVNGEACGCGCGKHEGGHHCEPEFPVLNNKRAASDFETLRLATERSGKRPTVFMLTIGNLAMRLARSQFSSNFFACAGYKIVDNLGFETVQAGIDAALDAKADIVVLCSSDDEYAQYAPKAFKILDGRALFVVAGAPACMDELKAQGITEFIHVRSNVLDTLKSFNEKLSI